MTSVKLALMGLSLALAANAQGSVITWTGNAGTDYATAGNWQGGVVPASNDYQDTARFADTSPANKTPNLAAGRLVGNLEFDSAGWTFSGAQLTLRNINSAGAGVNTVSAPIKTAYSPTYTIGSGDTLSLAGGLYQDGTYSLTLKGGGTLSVTGRIDGWSSSLAFYISDGLLKVGGSTPYVNGGIVYLQSATSAFELQNTVANTTALIGKKIINSTGQTLQVTDAGDGYSLVSVAAVPEPAICSTIAGLAALGLTARRRRA
jgi:hypothetical protein